VNPSIKEESTSTIGCAYIEGNKFEFGPQTLIMVFSFGIRIHLWKVYLFIYLFFKIENFHYKVQTTKLNLSGH